MTSNKIRLSLLYVIVILVLITAILVSCVLGIANISIIDALKIILSKIPKIGELVSTEGIADRYFTIVLFVRMPRIILAALVGMGLSAVGCTYQGMFKNPMADPYIVGISSGAALGATIGMIVGGGATVLGIGITRLSAFAGALITTLLVYNVARIGAKIPTTTLLLAGIAISYFFQSFISVIMIFNRQAIEKIVFWTMGSVNAASWKDIGFMIPILIISIIIMIVYARDLNAMLLGDDNAKSIGINTERTKKVLLIVSSILVASMVSISGIIGFVGLIIPHAVRLTVGPNNKVLIPFSALVGAVFMVICDTLARTLVPPMELPVGAITAVFGSPYFIYLLYKHKKKVML